MRGSRILTGAVITAAAVALPAGTAFGEGSLDVNPERATAGQTVTVTAMGCGGQGAGSTTASQAAFALAPVPGSQPLVVTGSFRVKDSVRPGEYTVRVNCPQPADPGAAPDPHRAQELFSQVTVGSAAAPARDALASPKAAPAKRQSSRSGGDEFDDPYGEDPYGEDPYGEGSSSHQGGDDDSRREDPSGNGQGEEGDSHHAEGGNARQDPGGNGGQAEESSAGTEAGGRPDAAGDNRQDKGNLSSEGGKQSYGEPHHERPHGHINWQQGGGWSHHGPHHGPHTGVGGAFGMDATETAAGAALLAAAMAGGLSMVRRRARRGTS